MLVAPSATLRELQQHIVTAMHSLTDTAGERTILPTVTADRLEMAALIALEVVAGGTVWPGDKPLRIARPRPTVGPLQVLSE